MQVNNVKDNKFLSKQELKQKMRQKLFDKKNQRRSNVTRR